MYVFEACLFAWKGPSYKKLDEGKKEVIFIEFKFRKKLGKKRLWNANWQYILLYLLRNFFQIHSTKGLLTYILPTKWSWGNITIAARVFFFKIIGISIWIFENASNKWKIAIALAGLEAGKVQKSYHKKGHNVWIRFLCIF